ncbi:MAG: DsbA family protein [Solirubrobacterales bacterium]|nr:DsbA family protein [Solirubrobacterales bacterium]
MAATLYIDVGSPFVYLALERLDRFDFGEIALRPVSLGALFKYAGRSSWGLSARREVGMAEVQARARVYGLPPVRWPDGWPSNYLHANRAAVTAEQLGRLEAFVVTALRAGFVDGADLGEDETVLDVAERAGLDRATVQRLIDEPAVKDRLREYTDAAFAAGVRGVPTLAIGGHLFWGDDQLEIAAANT